MFYFPVNQFLPWVIQMITVAKKNYLYYKNMVIFFQNNRNYNLFQPLLNYLFYI